MRLDDRDYKVGDILALNEIERTSSEDFTYTGNSTLVLVTYVLKDERFLLPGYAVLGIEPCLVLAVACCRTFEPAQIISGDDLIRGMKANGAGPQVCEDMASRARYNRGKEK